MRLRRLVVTKNQLAALPATVTALTCLTQLEAGTNRLKALPHGLGAMAALQQLCVSR